MKRQICKKINKYTQQTKSKQHALCTVLAPPITGTTKNTRRKNRFELMNSFVAGGPGSGIPVGCIRACDYREDERAS